MGGARKHPVRLYVAGALGLVIMIGLSEVGARYLSRIFAPAKGSDASLGRVVESRGKVARIRAGRAKYQPDPGEDHFDLRDGDRLETGADAEATVTLNSHDELRLGAGSTLAFELWNERDPASPVYVHVLSGDVTSLRTGVRGRAYVVRDGKLYLPGQKPGVRAPMLLVSRQTTLDLSLKDAPAEAATPDVKPVDDAEAPPARSDDPETLSNEYVEDMIASRQAQLQKCWMSRLKDKPNLKGKMILQFEITRRGRVREVSVVDSTLDDQALGACVATVIERLPFRAFRGPDIAVAYPIAFE